MNTSQRRKIWQSLGILALLLALLMSFGCTSEKPETSEPTSLSETTASPSTTTTAQTAPTTEQTDEPTTEESTQPGTEPTEEAPSESTTTAVTEPTEPPTTEQVEQVVSGILTPSTRPTEPTTNATEPTTQATEPTVQATEPTVQATEPTVQATEPVTQATEPTEPETQATEPIPQETTPPVTEPITEPPFPSDQSSFRIHFIDVGQADAALIQCDDKTMLIDGGNAEDSNLMYTYLKKLGVDHLDYVIGTHAHEDHIGGIAGALNYADVDRTLCPVTSFTTKAFRNFVKAVERHGSSIIIPSVGETFSLGSASCQVLGVNSTEDTNNSSIVLRIVYGSTSFLFTGDAEQEAETIILNRGYHLRSTVLKVGHHGSATSTGYRWLREVAPDYAVISVGKDNTYGHPTEAVLSRLRDADVTTFRTDMQGDIICTSDGQTVSFTVSRNANADVFGGIGGNSTQRPEETTPADGSQTEAEEFDYVLNTNSKKFHAPSCRSAGQISAKNRKDYHGTREELIEDGYDPCKNCDP